MGSCMSQEPDVDFDGPVDFNHFHILRAIGKGAFGKVCIVKKRDTKEMYALKYMSKIQMIQKRAVDNVFREIKLLRGLEHPYLVNLWFTFHDREDIFMVLDLMLGGDLNYHLEKVGRFSVQMVRLYIAEMAMVLDYLRSKLIIHRDLKPANMLLDIKGHVHLTDFNVATLMRPNYPITSTTGTKPYMAPEVIVSRPGGYSFPVDWWGLGVTAYELLRGSRPFTIDKNITPTAMHELISFTRPKASSSWDRDTCDILRVLLHPSEESRMQSVERLKKHAFFKDTNWEDIANKTVAPPFVPPQNRINCDPTHELEEMIVEPNPLHKKQHRLSKRNRRKEDETTEKELTKIEERFKVYNRITEKEKSAAPKAVAESGPQDGGASASPAVDGAVGGGDSTDRSGRNSREVVEDKHASVSATAWKDGDNVHTPSQVIPVVIIEAEKTAGVNVEKETKESINDKVREAPVKLEVIADVEDHSDEEVEVEKDGTVATTSVEDNVRDAPVKNKVTADVENDNVKEGEGTKNIPVVQVEAEDGAVREGSVNVEGGSMATIEGSGIGFVEGEGSTSLMRLVDGSGGLIREVDRAVEEERQKRAQGESGGNMLALPSKGGNSRRISQDSLSRLGTETIVVSGLPDDGDSCKSVEVGNSENSEEVATGDAKESRELSVGATAGNSNEATASHTDRGAPTVNLEESAGNSSEETSVKKLLEQENEVRETVTENGEHVHVNSN